MIYRKIGNDNKLISAIGFGTGFHHPKDQDGLSLRDTIKASIENGINFIDTAPVYGNGLSEEILGDAIKELNKNDIFLASKVSPEDTSFSGTIESAEKSLKRLKIDTIDLLQVHWPNPSVPLEETMMAMKKLVEQGKVKHIGVSNFTLSQIKFSANQLNNKLASIQAEYNLFERSVEDDVLPFCSQNNALLIAYSPLAQSKLVNGVKQQEFLKMISSKYEKTPGQIVLNWLCSNKNVVAIPNTSKKSRAIENAKSLSFKLSEDDYKAMSKILKTPINNVDVNKIRVSNDYNRKVYETIEEAIENKMGMSPSPVELAKEIRNGLFLKPIRLKEVVGNDKKYDLIEGRLRFWAWVIAFGWDKEIPALIWKNKEISNV